MSQKAKWSASMRRYTAVLAASWVCRSRSQIDCCGGPNPWLREANRARCSCTAPGGYSEEDQGREQFSISDQRSPAEVEKLLKSRGYKNINFRIGDGALGWKENAPFDGIICTYSPDHIPPDLLDQLRPGGKMIIPVSYSSKVQEFILIEKEELYYTLKGLLWNLQRKLWQCVKRLV